MSQGNTTPNQSVGQDRDVGLRLTNAGLKEIYTRESFDRMFDGGQPHAADNDNSPHRVEQNAGDRAEAREIALAVFVLVLLGATLPYLLVG